MKKTHAGRRWLPRDGDMRHRNLARGSRDVLVRATSRQAQGRSRARLRMHFRQLTGKAGLSDCFAPSPLLSTEWLLLLLISNSLQLCEAHVCTAFKQHQDVGNIV